MKAKHYLIIILLTIFSISCKSSNALRSLSEISDIATFHGNLDGSIVVVNTQGGPLTILEDDQLKSIITSTKTENALYVNVHQVQTKKPNKFKESEITFAQAKEFDLESVAYLKRVIDFFKNQKGKTIYVLGISFGAFMTQELISRYGIDIADGYLIMVGRLDIDENTWEPFSEGKETEYVYDSTGKYTIKETTQSTSEEKNMSRLAAGLGFNRYTEKLKSIKDLSKITYVYGDRDEQVGPLSSVEIAFLKNKKAKVILAEKGNHEQAIMLELSKLKATFGIK